jgi:hypothetical protein
MQLNRGVVSREIDSKVFASTAELKYTAITQKVP